MKLETPVITHADLVERSEKWLKNINCKIVFRDDFRAATENGEQPDCIGFKSGVSILIEAKATRSDFLADKKKRFRKDPQLGMGDWRIFICPPEVIHIKDLPDGWGLLWFDGNRVKKMHGIPTNAQLYSARPFEGCKRSEQSMLVSALRRLAIRGHFDLIYEKLEVSV